MYVLMVDMSEALANSKATAASKSCATEEDAASILTSVLCSLTGISCDIVGETFLYSGRRGESDYSVVFQ